LQLTYRCKQSELWHSSDVVLANANPTTRYASAWDLIGAALADMDVFRSKFLRTPALWSSESGVDHLQALIQAHEKLMSQRQRDVRSVCTFSPKLALVIRADSVAARVFSDLVCMLQQNTQHVFLVLLTHDISRTLWEPCVWAALDLVDANTVSSQEIYSNWFDDVVDETTLCVQVSCLPNL
jgi:hypothetical protein